MYRIFFGKFSGKLISELPSSYICWIVEFYDSADWALIQECKKELSHRLSLDWSPPEPEIPKLKKQIHLLKDRIESLKGLLAMSVRCKGNLIRLEGYWSNPEMLEADLKMIKEVNM